MSEKDKAQIEDGGPAFAAGAANEMASWTQEGMTLRDYFAAQALIGIGTWMPKGFCNLNSKEACELRAAFVYEQADAMLDARKG